MRRRALTSIHDVTPRTLYRVAELLELLRAAGVGSVTLLVVPGLDWSPDHLDRLREWSADGHRLAGHGWSHRAPPPRSLRHRLHAAVLSRDRAEHLSRSPDDVRERVRRCHRWFLRRELPPPDLYVPPAWALGPLTRADLTSLPIRWYETLGGFIHGRSGNRHLLPLVGFEADTRLRAAALAASNAANLLVAGVTGRPVRLALHPRDLELELGDRLRRLLGRPWRWVAESDVLA